MQDENAPTNKNRALLMLERVFDRDEEKKARRLERTVTKKAQRVDIVVTKVNESDDGIKQ